MLQEKRGCVKHNDNQFVETRRQVQCGESMISVKESESRKLEDLKEAGSI